MDLKAKLNAAVNRAKMGPGDPPKKKTGAELKKEGLKMKAEGQKLKAEGQGMKKEGQDMKKIGSDMKPKTAMDGLKALAYHVKNKGIY
jgi:hypothetical protein